MENGEIIATGSVENGTVTSQTIGIVATGYDVNNRAVETKSATSYTSSGGSGSFSVVLNAGSQISRVVFKTIGIATDLNLLSFAYRNINTTISATAVIENGTNSSTNVTATFTGFDSNDNPVEVKTANATISSKAVKEMSATFSLGSKITRVEVKTTPESSGNGVEVPDPSKFNQLDLSATSTYDLPGDVVSYYSFTAPTTSLYRFYTSYVGSSTMEEEPATRIQLFSDKNLQNQLASNDNSIGNIDGSLISKVDYTLTGGTTYYIKISPSALSSDFPYVRITVEQDADGSMDRAHILEDWELFSTSDFSSIFDIDYYKFELTEPTSVYYNIPNITIVLEDANGVELKKMVPGNKNSLFLQPGTYFLKSSTYLGYKDSDGDGLTDSQEQTGFRIISNGQVKVVKTNHLKSDSDQDGISDGTELLEGKFRTEDGYYQVIDDPSTVGFGSTEGTSFDLPSGYNWDTTDLLEIRTNILAAEEWKEKLKGYYNKVDEFSGSEVLGDVTKTELVYLSEEIGNAIINLNSVIEDMIMYIRDKGTNPDQVWLLMNTNSIEFLAYELKDPDRVGIASARASARMSISSESYDYVYWMKVGTLVHSAVKDRFTKDKGTPARFSNTVIPRTVRILRPDLVEDAARVDDDTPNSGGEAYLFELKTHNNTPANRAYYLKAQRQLNEYILYYQNAFKNKTVKKGTTGITTVDGLVEPPNWIPDGKVVPDTGTIPGTPFKAVLFHVLPDDGMVYYKLIKDTQDPKDVDPLIQKLKGNDRRQYEVEVEGEKVKATSVVKDKQSGKIAAIAYVGGALIIVILTNVDNTTGIGVADDPAAYATAGRLINAAIIAW
ncbi:hypothetical protein G5B47_18800 [Paenibacillus sp. 7124]|uniref:Uncharacterized protein n=2 Tax=Paenibacillus apii TaxID=1850370 RepID=A0A6M1PRT2_9BACL|nr:hypothetical protein [Paenibacillus apii]NGM84463.1 hypothetical protein [Paenibacillus apii]